MKKLFLTLLIATSVSVLAQVKVGNDATNLATDANLQVEGTSSSKQFVILKNGTIGVGTTTPKATLDVVGEPSNTAISDGFIAPRLTRAELLDKTYNTDQTGAIVYITTVNGNSDLTTQNINQTGYYYFDGGKWEKINKETILKANNNSNMVLEPNSLFFIQTGLSGAQNRALDVTLLSKAIAAKTPIVGVAISSTDIAQDETFSFITSGQNVTIANLGNKADVGEHLWFRPQQDPLYANNPGTGQALRIGVVTANLPDGDVVVNFNPTWRSEIELGPNYFTATTWAGKPADADVKDGDVFEVKDAGITYRRATWFNGAWLLDKGIFPFLQSLAYVAGDVIQIDYELYYANAAIPSNTPFTEGTTGATWRKTGSVQAENGETSSDGVTSISVPSFNTWTNLPITATLPTPGTYEVIAEMDVIMPGNGARGLVGIKANGTLDNTSVRYLGYQSAGATTDSHITIAHTFTVNAATTLQLAQYRLEGDIKFINDGASYIANSRILRLRYKKIGGFLPVTQVKSFTEPITITATTTNPTKATVALADYINIVDDGSGWCTVTMSYRHASSLGSTSGTGQYIFKLPAGYKFDNTVHPVYNANVTAIPTFPILAQIIPGSFGFATGRGGNQQIHALAYSDNQFRLVTGIGLQGAGLTVNEFIRSTYFQINDGGNNDIAYNISFRFKKQ